MTPYFSLLFILFLNTDFEKKKKMLFCFVYSVCLLVSKYDENLKVIILAQI